MKFRLYGILLIMMLLVVGCSGINDEEHLDTPKQDLVIETHDNSIRKKVSILAVGDNLIHDTLYHQAYTRANGQGFEFSDPYKAIEEYVQSADIATINQETPLASSLYPLSNYPRFNSPIEVGKHMVDIGFDVFNHANNHAYDMGAKGLEATLDFMESQNGVISVGAYRNENEKSTIKYLERNGLKIAFLGFTQHTNGINLTVDSPIGVYTTQDEDTMKELVEKAKSSCDIVVVQVHWGDEGSFEVNHKQKELAQDLASWGADLIIGHHPHVLQGGEYIHNSDGTTSYVFYSLGNFISAQAKPENMPSGMLLVEFSQNKQGVQPQISKVNFIPTVTHYGPQMSNIRIIPFEDYTEKLASQHGVCKEYEYFGYDYLEKVFENINT